jgi:hypothetical protein
LKGEKALLERELQEYESYNGTGIGVIDVLNLSREFVTQCSSNALCSIIPMFNSNSPCKPIISDFTMHHIFDEITITDEVAMPISPLKKSK